MLSSLCECHILVDKLCSWCLGRRWAPSRSNSQSRYPDCGDIHYSQLKDHICYLCTLYHHWCDMTVFEDCSSVFHGTVSTTETSLTSHSETHGHVRYVVVSSERHLLCEVCPKLEVVQVDQQTVYYVGELTLHCFYEELYSSL